MKRAVPAIVLLTALLGGCVTANVDEMTFDAPVAGMASLRAMKTCRRTTSMQY